MTGVCVGKITVLSRHGTNENGQATWLCHCGGCGKEYVTSGVVLRTNVTACHKCAITAHNQDPKKIAKMTLPSHLGPKRKVLRMYLENAKIRGLEWSLSETEATDLLLGACCYCGDTKSMTKYGISHNGIDRTDPSIGYTKENCVSCCKLCNRAKSNFTLEQFDDWIIRVYNYRFGVDQ